MRDVRDVRDVQADNPALAGDALEAALGSVDATLGAVPIGGTAAGLVTLTARVSRRANPTVPVGIVGDRLVAIPTRVVGYDFR